MEEKRAKSTLVNRTGDVSNTCYKTRGITPGDYIIPTSTAERRRSKSYRRNRDPYSRLRIPAAAAFSTTFALPESTLCEFSPESRKQEHSDKYATTCSKSVLVRCSRELTGQTALDVYSTLVVTVIVSCAKFELRTRRDG